MRVRVPAVARLLVVAALLLGVLGAMLPPGSGLPRAAASTLGEERAQLTEARKELRALQARLDGLAEEQVDAENDLERTLINIEEVRGDLGVARDELAALRARLAVRLAEMYKSRGSEALDVLGAVFAGDDVSLGAIAHRVSMVSHIAEMDDELIASVVDRARELDRLEAELTKQQAVEQEKSARYEASVERTLESLERSKDEYTRLRARVAVLEEAARKRAEEARRAKAARRATAAWVFPVAGPNSFSDTFGAPRSGGRRHKGADIFTARHTPLVAVENAVISATNPRESGLGGITIHLKNARGTTYYYAHLQSIKSGLRAGVRVQAGQVIGYAGNTGNARTTPVHLHFEIRPGGVAINPYPTLLKYR